MNNRICISIPITSEKLGDNLKIIKRALNKNPDFIELRFDFIEDLIAVNQNFLVPLVELIKSSCSSIFTFRSFKEGGKIELDEETRFQMLKTLIISKPNYLDVEMGTEENILSQIIQLAIKENVTLIFSHHEFNKLGPKLEADYFNYYHCYVNRFINRLEEKFNVDKTYINGYIYKIIFTAEKIIDNLIPLNLCANLGSKFNIISFCMGKKGIFSRIFCTKFGSFLTYASLEKETAPGQIKIEKIRKYHELLFNH